MTDQRDAPALSDDHDAEPESRSPVKMVVLSVALLLAVGIGWARLRPAADPPPRFCTAEGIITDDGKTYHRDADRDCGWVDQDGEPLVAQGE